MSDVRFVTGWTEWKSKGVKVVRVNFVICERENTEYVPRQEFAIPVQFI